MQFAQNTPQWCEYKMRQREDRGEQETHKQSFFTQRTLAGTVHTVCHYVSVTFPLRQEERLTCLVHIIHMRHEWTPQSDTHTAHAGTRSGRPEHQTPPICHAQTTSAPPTSWQSESSFFKICRLIGYFWAVMSKRGFYDSNLSCGFLLQKCIILCHLEMILAWFWWDLSFRLRVRIHYSAEMLWWLCYTS